MMKNYDESAEINHNANWLYILDNPYRILIIGDAGLDKTNALLNLIKHQGPDVDKINFHIKDPFESKYPLLNGTEKVEIKKLKNSQAFNDYSQTTDDIYQNLKGYNRTKKRKGMIMFDDMVADMETNKKN